MVGYDIKFWHLRLGHISERKMNELSEQGAFDRRRLGTFSFCENYVYRKLYFK